MDINHQNHNGQPFINEGKRQNDTRQFYKINLHKKKEQKTQNTTSKGKCKLTLQAVKHTTFLKQIRTSTNIEQATIYLVDNCVCVATELLSNTWVHSLRGSPSRTPQLTLYATGRPCGRPWASRVYYMSPQPTWLTFMDATTDFVCHRVIGG